jgi:hypothetical protein
VRSLATIGRQIEQLAARRLPQRRVLCVVGTRDQIDWQRIADLEGAGAEVVIVTSGVPRDPDRAAGGMTEHEMGAKP